MNSQIKYINTLIDTLKDQGNFLALQSYAQGFLDSNVAENCVALADFISGKLQQEGSQIQQQDPKMFNAYQLMWYSLIFRGFISLSPEDQANILQSHLLYAVQIGADLDQALANYFAWQYPLKKIQEIFRDFAKHLEQNSETLGTIPITIEGRRFLPSIRYWLMDYARTPSKVARRGAVERLNYVNQSANARPLTQVQKQQLLKILKFYDQLLNPEAPPRQSLRTSNFELENAGAMPPPSVNIDQKLRDLRVRTGK